MPRDAKSYAPRISPSTWERHRCRITTFFVDQKETLRKVAEVMKTYGLHASESQYERQLKAWGIRKNRTRNEWRLINRVVEGRRRQGKDSSVLINGVEQSKEKLDREFARSEYRRYGGLQPGLPNHIEVSSPPAVAPATEMHTSCSVDLEDELVLYHDGGIVERHPDPNLIYSATWDASIKWITKEYKKARKTWTTLTFKLADLGLGGFLVTEEPQLENLCDTAPNDEPDYGTDLFDHSPSPSRSLGIPNWESVDVTSEEWSTRGWDVFFGEWGMA